MEYKTYIFKNGLYEIHCVFEGHFLVKLSFIIIKDDKSINSNALMKNLDLKSANLDEDFLLLSNELYLYFRGSIKQFSQPIRFTTGTEFEQDIWLTLNEIPYGETRSYKWIAQKIGRIGAYRAVGNALRKNPLPLILPCHRVIASDGSLCGFSGGIKLKRWLLEHEKRHNIKVL